MSPQLQQIGFRFAFFVAFVSGILVLVTESGTAEHVVSQVSFLIGLIFLAVVIIAVRRTAR